MGEKQNKTQQTAHTHTRTHARTHARTLTLHTHIHAPETARKTTTLSECKSAVPYRLVLEEHIDADE